MRKDRLLKLADFLENVVAKKPRYKFNMVCWADDNFDPNHCWTAACALGWATTIFRDLKLDATSVPVYKTKGYKFEGYLAAQEFFNIQDFEAENLFRKSRNNETPKQVA